MNNVQKIDELPEISFIENASLEDIKNRLVSDYQERYVQLTGVQAELPMDDVNRMILNSCALQIYQAFQYVERAGRLNSLKYAYGSFLDNIAALKNVVRQKALPSTVVIRFNLSAVRSADIEVPAGTRVSTGYYNVYWELPDTQKIKAGSLYADFTFTCTEVGDFSNGYNTGEINELVDPVPYVDTITNVTESNGGCNDETDEALANRVLIAPSAYSVAGTEDAYMYHIKSFNGDITDVLIKVTDEATIYIYILTSGGNIPSQSMVESLQKHLDESDDIKPLTDRVVVAVPEQVNYEINMTYYVDRSRYNQEQTIKDAVESAVLEYISEQASSIGKDIDNSLLIQKVMNAGAKRVVVRTPNYSTVDETEVATNNPTRTVVYGGLE